MDFDEYYISLMRNSNYVNEMNNRLKNNNLLDEFVHFSRKDKLNLLCFIRLFKTIEKTKLREEEKTFLDSYDEMVEKLFVKNRNRDLSSGESKVLLFILSYFSLYNNSYKEEDITIYFNNYYYKGTKYFLVEELILLNNLIVSFINTMMNSEVNFKYEQFSGPPVHINNINGVKEINVSYSLYYDLLEKNKISKKDYYYLMVYQVYSLLHEFYHSIQFDLFNDNKNYDDLENLKKELVVLTKNREFYDKYHNNFKFEKEADEFAIKYLKAFLKDIIPLNMLNFSLKKILSQIKKINDKNLDEDVFKRLLNEEYEKVNTFSEEIVNHLKLR